MLKYKLLLIRAVCAWHVLLFLPRADGVMRTMNTEKLIKTLPTIQNQLDALLDFQVNIVFRETRHGQKEQRLSCY